MNKVITIVLLSMILVNCSDNKDSESIEIKSPTERFNKESDINYFLNSKSNKEIYTKQVNNFIFRTSVMSSYDFLERKNTKVNKSDEIELKSESILILEIEDINLYQDVLKSKELTMSKDSTIQYLIGDIQKDLLIEQNDKLIESHGVIYEGKNTKINKLRIMFLFHDLNRRLPFKIIYDDHIFGKGLIKFTIKKNNT